MKRLVLLLALVACSSKKEPKPHVFVMNGLDVPVTVSIDSEGGKKQLELAPKSRVPTGGVGGKATVKVTTKAGALISESPAYFFKARTAGCYDIYNVMGAAAYVHEDVVYGTGFGTPQIRRRAGEISEQECGVSFAFRDPPKEIVVSEYGPAGDNRGWMHMDGDGGWVTAVTSLLDDTGRHASQSRGAAQRIVRTVVTHDPQNPALPAIKARLQQMQLLVPEASPGNLLAQPERRKRR